MKHRQLTREQLPARVTHVRRIILSGKARTESIQRWQKRMASRLEGLLCGYEGQGAKTWCEVRLNEQSSQPAKAGQAHTREGAGHPPPRPRCSPRDQGSCNGQGPQRHRGGLRVERVSRRERGPGAATQAHVKLAGEAVAPSPGTLTGEAQFDVRSEKDPFLKCGEKERLITTSCNDFAPNISFFFSNAKRCLCLGVRPLLGARGVKIDLAARLVALQCSLVLRQVRVTALQGTRPPRAPCPVSSHRPWSLLSRAGRADPPDGSRDQLRRAGLARHPPSLNLIEGAGRNAITTKVLGMVQENLFCGSEALNF